MRVFDSGVRCFMDWRIVKGVLTRVPSNKPPKFWSMLRHGVLHRYRYVDRSKGVMYV